MATAVLLVFLTGTSISAPAPAPAPKNFGPGQPINPELLHSLTVAPGVPVPLAFAPSGKALATRDGANVRLFDPMSGKELLVLVGEEQQQINALAFSPDGQILAAASEGKSIIFYDPIKGEVRKELIADAAVECLSFTPIGKELLTGDRNGSVQLWDVATGKVVRSFGKPVGRIMSVTISPDGKLAATSGEGKSIRLWDIGSGKMVRDLESKPSWKIGEAPQPPSAIKSVAFSPDGKTLAADNNDGSVWLWDLKTGAKQKEIGEPGPPFWPTMGISAIAFTPNGMGIVTAGGLRTFQIYETDTGKELARLSGTADTQKYRGSGPQTQWVAMSADGRLLASGCTDGAIRIWSLAGGK